MKFPQFDGLRKYKDMNAQLYYGLGMAKSDTTHELDTTNPFINKSGVEAKQVRVVFRLT